MSYAVNGWVHPLVKGSWQHLTIKLVRYFAIKIINDGYWCGVDMWQTLSTRMSLSTCIC
jgi:hypothetical protein